MFHRESTARFANKVSLRSHPTPRVQKRRDIFFIVRGKETLEKWKERTMLLFSSIFSFIIFKALEGTLFFEVWKILLTLLFASYGNIYKFFIRERLETT